MQNIIFLINHFYLSCKRNFSHDKKLKVMHPRCKHFLKEDLIINVVLMSTREHKLQMGARSCVKLSSQTLQLTEKFNVRIFVILTVF